MAVVASSWVIPRQSCVARNSATWPWAWAAQSAECCSAQTEIAYTVPSDAVTVLVRRGAAGTGLVVADGAADDDAAAVVGFGTGLELEVCPGDELVGVG